MRRVFALVVGVAILAACSGQMDGVEGAAEAPGVTVMDGVGVAGVATFAVACELDDLPVSLPFDLEPGTMLVCAYEVDVTAHVTADSDRHVSEPLRLD